MLMNYADLRMKNEEAESEYQSMLDYETKK